jgi:hypothetical protein
VGVGVGVGVGGGGVEALRFNSRFPAVSHVPVCFAPYPLMLNFTVMPSL